MLYTTTCSIIPFNNLVCALISQLPIINSLLYHREHDKGPDDFSLVLHKLMDNDIQFTISLLGSHTTDIPGIELCL